MLKYTLRRLLQSLVTVLIVITLVFLLMRLMPIEGYFPEGYDKLTEEQKQRSEKHWTADPCTSRAEFL